MEIGSDVAVNFDDLWEIGKDEENSFFKKNSLTGIFTPIIELNAEYASSTKTPSKQCSRYSFLVAKGKWNSSLSGEKDDEGNSKASAEVKIEKETNDGVNFSANARGSFSTDKDQKFRATAEGSVKIEKKTDSGINFSISGGGKISKDQDQNTQQSVYGAVSLDGDF